MLGILDNPTNPLHVGLSISGLSDSLTLQPARLLASQTDLTESC